MNTADSPGVTLVILDNLGWSCDVANIFIRQREIQIVSMKLSYLKSRFIKCKLPQTRLYGITCLKIEHILFYLTRLTSPFFFTAVPVPTGADPETLLTGGGTQL